MAEGGDLMSAWVKDGGCTMPDLPAVIGNYTL